MFMLDLRKRLIFLVLIVAGATVSPLLTAWGVTAAGLVAAAVNMSATARHTVYPLSWQLRDVCPMFLACLPWALLVWWLSSVWSARPVVEVMVLFSGAALMTLLTARVSRVVVLDEMVGRVRGYDRG